MSSRMKNSDQPFIEDILEKYSSIENLHILALGSSYWNPPPEVLQTLTINETSIHRYGGILGLDSLRNIIKKRLKRRGIDTNDLDIVITAGANQGFINIALALCDPNQSAVIVAPYYFCHKTSLQLAGSKVSICPFTSHDFMPDWIALQSIILTESPIMVVITTPNNPSGAVWKEEHFRQLVSICRAHHTWLVIDQTYEDFIYEITDSVNNNSEKMANSKLSSNVATFSNGDDQNIFVPCRNTLEYDRIIHIHSFSKAYGMPGWRVGYTVTPSILGDSIRKLQDTIPTCAPIISQKLALKCLELEESLIQSLLVKDKPDSQSLWVKSQITSLQVVREEIWKVVKILGTIKTDGAFYFLLPVPTMVDELEAVDILANNYKILLMPGYPFGAPGYLRLSYGSLEPSRALEAVDKLKHGIEYLMKLSTERKLIIKDL